MLCLAQTLFLVSYCLWNWCLPYFGGSLAISLVCDTTWFYQLSTMVTDSQHCMTTGTVNSQHSQFISGFLKKKMQLGPEKWWKLTKKETFCHSKSWIQFLGEGGFFLCEVLHVLMYDCMGFHPGASLSPTIKNMFSRLISSCRQTNTLIKI